MLRGINGRVVPRFEFADEDEPDYPLAPSPSALSMAQGEVGRGKKAQPSYDWQEIRNEDTTAWSKVDTNPDSRTAAPTIAIWERILETALGTPEPASSAPSGPGERSRSNSC